MTRCWAVVIALLLVITAILALDARCGKRPRSGKKPRREGYLIYPYLDLDEPGERGDYYALTRCP
jgi:hypothetical protein